MPDVVDEDNGPDNEAGGGDVASGSEGKNRLDKEFKETATNMAVDTLGMVGNTTSAVKGVIDAGAGAAGAIGFGFQRISESQRSKLDKAKATAQHDIAKEVSISEREAYNEAIKTASAAKKLLEKQRKNQIAAVKNASAVAQKTQNLIQQYNREAYDDVKKSAVKFQLNDGRDFQIQFKKIENKDFEGGSTVPLAVLKTMEELNKEMFEAFGRNFENKDFVIARPDKQVLFESLPGNASVPPVEYLRGFMKKIRGETPVLREVGVVPNAGESNEARMTVTGGGKTQRKKRISKRKKRISKRKKRISKRKKRISKRKR